MRLVPASAITIADGEITIDVELLAPAGQHRSPKSARPRQERVMAATAWDLAATTTIEHNTTETLAPLRVPITLYAGGQFTGGCDIVREMNTSGELHEGHL